MEDQPERGLQVRLFNQKENEKKNDDSLLAVPTSLNDQVVTKSPGKGQPRQRNLQQSSSPKKR